jgi:hypothetical protein
MRISLPHGWFFDGGAIRPDDREWGILVDPGHYRVWLWLVTVGVVRRPADDEDGDA